VIAAETVARIRHLFFAEHWKIGTIAAELGLHHETVKAAVNLLNRPKPKPRPPRPSVVDPYVPFIEETLRKYPRLVATRIYDMIRARGYQASAIPVRRRVAKLRPKLHEAFLHRRLFAGEEAQVDWAHFGQVDVGRARRRLSCFVMTLSYSRALYLEFFYDQSQENFLRGHVRAFTYFGGVPRVCLYDNLRSAVLERRGEAVHFHPRLIELCAHYHFQARPCAPARGNEKGRVERAIRYIRESFFEARVYTTLTDFNRQAWTWRDEVAHVRPWPDGDERTVAEAFEDEKPRLLGLPSHPMTTDFVGPVHSAKTIYVRFDLNDYSIPPKAVGRALTLVASDTCVRILDGASRSRVTPAPTTGESGSKARTTSKRCSRRSGARRARRAPFACSRPCPRARPS
jgi:transposase